MIEQMKGLDAVPQKIETEAEVLKRMEKAPATDTPVGEYKVTLQKSGQKFINRLLVATPTTGMVRMEWVQARYGQIIPTNWSMVQMIQSMNGYIPQEYTIPDAQNLIFQAAIQGGFEWVLLIEDDTMLPADAFIRFNEYMRDKDVPIVSGLYFTRSRPPEPMIYRGRGTSFVTGWKLGDKVWADGVPTGALLIHTSIIKAMYDESPEYNCGGVIARRIMENPTKMWFDEETGTLATTTGTTDLEWCTRIIEGDYLRKAGWTKIAKKKYPFLVDTGIFCKHIDRNSGEVFP